MVTAEQILNNQALQDAVNTAAQKLGLATQEIGEILVHGKAMEGVAELSALGLTFTLTAAGTYAAYRIAYTDCMSDYLIDEYDTTDDSDWRPMVVGMASMAVFMMSAGIAHVVRNAMMKIMAPKYMVLIEEVLPRLGGG